jgi:hypothetical protein
MFARGHHGRRRSQTIFKPSDKLLMIAHWKSSSTPPAKRPPGGAAFAKATPDKPPRLHARGNEKAALDARRGATVKAANALSNKPTTADTRKTLVKKR